MTSDNDLRPEHDISKWCGYIHEQDSLNSSVAHACVATIEYLQKKLFGKYVRLSTRFNYKVARKLLHQEGDVGSYPRMSIAALKLFGSPPEEYWPYNIPDFDKEPPAFCYALARNFRVTEVMSLDFPGVPKASLLRSIKRSLEDGFPLSFGFRIYDSISQAAGNGKIPNPWGEGWGEKGFGWLPMFCVG
jgi:C1A family cysteine protease